MRAQLTPTILPDDDRHEAEAILRACVHCGFCNATCPTYQLLGDERDGPRGRIYQIRSLLEGQPVGGETQTHLDRCLTCRACESTCPSGVRYARLLDLAKPVLERQVPRTPGQATVRWALRHFIPSRLFALVVKTGRLLRGVLPAILRRHVPLAREAGPWPPARHPEQWLALEGCAQSAARPSINAAAARLMDRIGKSLVQTPDTRCCGALAFHLGDVAGAKSHARRNIDSWAPALADGASGVLSTSSGCSVFLKEYGELLRDDPKYAERARLVAASAMDATELITPDDLANAGIHQRERIAVQCPCTLQHGLRGGARLDALVAATGAQPCTVADPHLCCGSAGSYSILQPSISRRLRARKVKALTADGPDRIVTANIGCLLHLENSAAQPVLHWLEWAEEAVGRAPRD